MPSKHIHASCVAFASEGVVLLGPSGSGKSDLALRLIDRGAQLVADDQVMLSPRQGGVFASAPVKIAGLVEIRGLGVMAVPYVSDVRVSLAVSLVPRKAVERLPEREYYECVGCRIPLVRLYPFDASSALKIEKALDALRENVLLVGAFCG